jgi:DNA-binding MarR family transcriptional regulator
MPRRRLPMHEDAPPPLEARIAAGLHKIGLAMKQQAWQQANQEGISATQAQILALLVGQGPLSGKELGDRLSLTLPTISDSARVLVEKQLVAKSADPRHPRASLYTPTARGAELGQRARAWPEFMAEAVTALSAEEQRVFFGGVVKMIRSLQDQGLIPLDRMCATCTHFRPHVRPGDHPHHCAFVDAPLAGEELRLDCPEHQLADPSQRAQLWRDLVRTP